MLTGHKQSLGCVVLDSNVFAKLLLAEPDQVTAVALLAHIVDAEIDIVEPEIFRFEVISVAAQNGLPLGLVDQQLKRFEHMGAQFVPIEGPVWSAAISMAETGHPKSSYPSIYDSAYHALAIAKGGLLITADQRHIAKARGFGNVAHLSQWRTVLQPA